MRRTSVIIAMIVVAVLVATGSALWIAGRVNRGTTPASSGAGAASAGATTSPTAGQKQPSDTWYPPTGDRIAYARRIGGVSHRGQTLYVILAATEKTEAAARARLDAAIPKFADTELYYVVQKSDNFAGLPAGEWIVIESYRDKAHALLKENLDYGRLVGPDPRVVKVVVKTTEPIPVYEDLGPSDSTTATTAP